MSQLIGGDGPAQDLQASAIGHPLERPVVDDTDDLRSDEDPQPCLKAAAAPQRAQRLIGDSALTRGNLVILHEGAEQACVPLRLGNQQIEDFDEAVLVGRTTVLAHGGAQVRARRSFTQLKRGDGVRDQSSFATRQRVIERRWNPPGMCCLTAEVREPDGQILKHGIHLRVWRLIPRYTGYSAIPVGQLGQIVAG